MRHFFDQVLNPSSQVPAAGVQVAVYPHNSGTLATIYADAGITVKANPLTTDSTGSYDFYVADGRYDINISGANIIPKTLSDVSIFDVSIPALVVGANSKYPCTATGINQAVIDAIAAGTGTYPGGVVDASACTGDITMTSQISIGNSAQNALKFIGPNGAKWTFTMTDGTSCGILQYGGSSIYGPGLGGGSLSGRWALQRGVGSNLKATYCTRYAQTGLNADLGYYYASGFIAYQPDNVTSASGYGAIFAGSFDASKWQSLEVSDSAGNGAWVYGTCCGTTFDQLVSNSSGGIPLTIGQPPILANTTDTSFINCSIDHPLSGKSNIVIDQGSGSGITRGIRFYNLYGEGTLCGGGTCAAGTGQTVPMLSIKQNVDDVVIYGGSLNSEQQAPGSSIACVQVEAINGANVGVLGLNHFWCTNFQSSTTIINDLAKSTSFNGKTIAGNLTYFDSYNGNGQLVAGSYNNVIQADVQVGADVGAKLIAAQTALPSTGGVIDARGILTGTCTTNVSLGTNAKPVTLLVNPAAQITGTCQITIAGSASGIDGSSGIEGFDFDQSGTAQWTYTGTNGALITVSPGVRAPFLKNLRLSGTGSSGTADCVFMSGLASNSTSVTSSLVQNVSCDGFARDGFHLENDVYGFNWYNVAGTNNGRYGFYGSDNGSTTSALIQAKLFGYRFCGNKSSDAQAYLHSPSAASVEASFDGGTVCDTPVANTSGNGFHFDGTTAFITVKSTHFETLGGSVAGGTPDISNSPIVITTANGIYNLEGNNFVATSAKCTGGVLRNAIAESFAGTATNQVFSRGNAYGNYAKNGPAGTNCVAFDGSGVTGGLLARVYSDEVVLASNFNLGSHVFPTLLGGYYVREDGTNFTVLDGSGNTKTSIANATGFLTTVEGTAPSGTASSDILYADSTAHRWKMNNNNSGADVVVGAATTDTFTNKTLTTPVFSAVAFASLGTPANGTLNYCNDCNIANPCTSGGTGALAKRLNGAWVCT